MPTSDRGAAGNLLVAALGLSLGACALPQGESGRDAEFARLDARSAEAERQGPVRLAEVGPAMLAVDADGAHVAVSPLAGHCVVEDSAEAHGGSGLGMIAPCSGPEPDRAEAFPGLITVSVSAAPMFPDPDRRASALRELGDFLGSVPGKRMVSRGGSGRGVELRDLRQIGDALYVRVRESDGPAFMAPEFWRALFEVKGRMVLVSVSCLAEKPASAEQMLAILAAQVARIRAENGGQSYDEELRLAAGFRAVPVADARSDPSAGIGAVKREIAASRPGPGRAPAPPVRPQQG